MQPANSRPIFSFAIISDTHISSEEALAADHKSGPGRKSTSKYRAILERLNSMKPEFVVHLGDIAHPTPSEPGYDDAAFAFHKESKSLSMPLHLVPGNHDIGEKLHAALPDLDPGVSITKSNIAMYERYFGKQQFSFRQQGCVFITVNSLLINSGLEDEQNQWDWLEETLKRNACDRIFVFSHYPLYLSSSDEADHYDNIGEPGRSRMLQLLQKYNVEGLFSGHVHNFFFNRLDGLRQYVLPSTSIIRHDYLEYFKSPPTREVGRFDPAKTGFYWVDVFENGHVPHLIRTNGGARLVTHSWLNNGSTAMIDLRRPWCDEADIATPWAVEIFERKLVRNDYPLFALWEMGIKNFRIPITDILNPKTAKRVEELMGLGHQFCVVMFGVPNKERQARLASFGEGIKSVEIVGLLRKWPEMAASLAKLKQKAGYKIFLTAVRPEIEGWTTHHGLHTDLSGEIRDVLGQEALKQAIDGVVFGIRQNVRPFDGAIAVEECLQDSGLEYALHIPCVGFDRASAPTDDRSRIRELNRTAEAAMLARLRPNIPVVLDNFVELDRGYFNCRGMVDRLYNPKDGSRILTTLDHVLPSELFNPRIFNIGQHRIISAESKIAHALLIVAGEAETHSTVPLAHFEEEASKQGNLVDLTTGTSEQTNYQSLVEDLMANPTNAPAKLFIVDHQGG